MTTSTMDQLTDTEGLRDRLMSAVDSIRETLDSCSEEAEHAGFYPERGWRAMQDSGLFKLRAPRELGGHEADPVTQLEVIEEIASIDGGAGWTYFIGVDSLALMGGWLPDEGLEDFLVDGALPRTAMTAAPIGTAPPVEGGFRVTGRWPFGSGSAHAERIAGSCRVTADSGPPVISCMFMADDVTLHDNWHVNALRGTGSQDFSVTDLFVPNDRVFNFMASAARGGAMFRIGNPSFVAIDHGAFALGVGRHAIEAMTVLAKTKMRGVVKPVGVASSERFQFELGRSQIMLDAARAQLHAVCQKAWDMAQDGDARSPDILLQLQCSAISATEVAGKVCRTMFRYGGAQIAICGQRLGTVRPRHPRCRSARPDERRQLRIAGSGRARLPGDHPSLNRRRRWACGSTEIARLREENGNAEFFAPQRGPPSAGRRQFRAGRRRRRYRIRNASTPPAETTRPPGCRHGRSDRSRCTVDSRPRIVQLAASGGSTGTPSGSSSGTWLSKGLSPAARTLSRTSSAAGFGMGSSASVTAPPEAETNNSRMVELRFLRDERRDRLYIVVVASISTQGRPIYPPCRRRSKRIPAGFREPELDRLCPGMPVRPRLA